MLARGLREHIEHEHIYIHGTYLPSTYVLHCTLPVFRFGFFAYHVHIPQYIASTLRRAGMQQRRTMLRPALCVRRGCR